MRPVCSQHHVERCCERPVGKENHGGILEGQEWGSGSSCLLWELGTLGLCEGNQPAETLPAQTEGASLLLTNLLPSHISFELAVAQGGERCSCMNNKTSILLSIRRDKKPPGTQRKTTLLYRSPVGYSAILLYGASLTDAGSTSCSRGPCSSYRAAGRLGRAGSAPVPRYTVQQL